MYTEQQASTGFSVHTATLRSTQSTPAQQWNTLGSITCCPIHGTDTCRAPTRTLKNPPCPQLDQQQQASLSSTKVRRRRLGRFVCPTARCTDPKKEFPVEICRGKQSVTQLRPTGKHIFELNQSWVWVLLLSIFLKKQTLWGPRYQQM